jgi:hypothetical protein
MPKGLKITDYPDDIANAIDKKSKNSPKAGATDRRGGYQIFKSGVAGGGKTATSGTKQESSKDPTPFL